MWAALSALIKPVFSVIDKYIDNETERERLKAKIQEQLLRNNAAELKAASEIITAEARGESWLQRNWRPILMLTIVAIVANNYLLAPYVQAFGGVAVNLDLPPELFNLMTVGVGGYVVSRGAEKVSKTIAPAVAERRKKSKYND